MKTLNVSKTDNFKIILKYPHTTPKLQCTLNHWPTLYFARNKSTPHQLFIFSNNFECTLPTQDLNRRSRVLQLQLY